MKPAEVFKAKLADVRTWSDLVIELPEEDQPIDPNQLFVDFAELYRRRHGEIPRKDKTQLEGLTGFVKLPKGRACFEFYQDGILVYKQGGNNETDEGWVNKYAQWIDGNMQLMEDYSMPAFCLYPAEHLSHDIDTTFEEMQEPLVTHKTRSAEYQTESGLYIKVQQMKGDGTNDALLTIRIGELDEQGEVVTPNTSRHLPIELEFWKDKEQLTYRRILAELRKNPDLFAQPEEIQRCFGAIPIKSSWDRPICACTSSRIYDDDELRAKTLPPALHQKLTSYKLTLAEGIDVLLH